jgi:DNA-binding Lrp family transcriptional regulator
MILGFILIKAASNYEHKVFNQLSEISEISKLHPVPGEYDLIAQVESESYDKLRSIAENKIESIEGVLRTKIVTEPKF